MNQPSPQVGVGIIVLKYEGDKTYALLHQRKGAHGTNYWGSGGGHLELGESLQAGALRELTEEAGERLKVRNVRFLGVSNFVEMPPKHYVDISFAADWESGEPLNTEPHKMTPWQWFPLDDLPSPLLPPVKNYLRSIETGQKFFDGAFAA